MWYRGHDRYATIYICSSASFLRCVYEVGMEMILYLLFTWHSTYSDLTHSIINQEKEIILKHVIMCFPPWIFLSLAYISWGATFSHIAAFQRLMMGLFSVTSYYTVFQRQTTCWVYFQYLMQVRLDYRLTWILSMFKCQIEMQTAEDKSEVICGFSALSLVSSELCNNQHS